MSFETITDNGTGIRCVTYIWTFAVYVQTCAADVEYPIRARSAVVENVRATARRNLRGVPMISLSFNESESSGLDLSLVLRDL